MPVIEYYYCPPSYRTSESVYLPLKPGSSTNFSSHFQDEQSLGLVSIWVLIWSSLDGRVKVGIVYFYPSGQRSIVYMPLGIRDLQAHMSEGQRGSHISLPTKPGFKSQTLNLSQLGDT